MRNMVTAILAAALAAAAAPASPASASDPGMAAPLAGPTMLRAGTTIVKLRPGGLRAPRGARAELAIEGLAFDAPPGVMYEVSLQAPSGRRALLGTISFYNETAPGYGGGPARSGNRRAFDATEALRRLGGRANALVFEPTSGVTGPGVRLHPNPAARPRFAAVSLRWR